MGRPKGGFKKPKCIVPKCKNTPSRTTPEGELVCRTHLARRNMFGAVDAESPTTSYVKRGGSIEMVLILYRLHRKDSLGT